jgi:hypothetical protein
VHTPVVREYEYYLYTRDTGQVKGSDHATMLIRVFRDYSERIFTTETQRGEAAIGTRNISRKDAKAAKVGKNGENHLREYFIFPLRTWRLCALAGGISESENLRLPEYLSGTL